MATLTRAAIVSVLGQVDDHLAAELIATEATPEELVEAKTWVANDEPMMNARRHLAHGRVGILVSILMRAEEDAPATAGDQE